MRVRRIRYLLLFVFVTACVEIQSTKLPSGITLLKGIDPGFLFPAWSPDGKTIVVSYVQEAAPDPILPLPEFGPGAPRHDIVLIDTRTWKSSIVMHFNSGILQSKTWSPDSKSFAVLWEGPDGRGLYVFRVNDTKPVYLSKNWGMSPDWTKFAAVNGSNLEISDIHTQNVNAFKLPAGGSWWFNSWSSDMKLLTLIHRDNVNDHYENIFLFDLNSGTLSPFTNDIIYLKLSPTISPNGQLIAYVIYNDTEAKLLISRLNKSCEWTMPVDKISFFAWSPDSQRIFFTGTDGVYVADLNVLFGPDFSNGARCQ